MADQDQSRHQRLRATVGTLLALLPIVLAVVGYLIFDLPLKGSVSQYYHHHPGLVGVYVGILCFNGISLIVYPGRGTAGGRVLTTLAGVLAVVVAWFPTREAFTPETVHWAIARIHLGATIAVLLLLTYMSGIRFPKRGSKVWLHKTCAAVSLACLITIAITAIPCPDLTIRFLPQPQTFFLESTALIALGVSWVATSTWESIRSGVREIGWKSG